MTLRTLNYGNYGIFLIMGNAGFCPSAVFLLMNPRPSSENQGTSGPEMKVQGLTLTHRDPYLEDHGT